MDPFSSLLLPFLPLALLTATFVALVRRVFPKLDGPPVLAVVALVAGGVVLWSQARAGLPVAWLKVAADVPIVFVLASGGVTFVQRLHDRGFSEIFDGDLVHTDADLGLGRELLSQLEAQKREVRAMSAAFAERNVKVAGTVEITSPPDAVLPSDPPASTAEPAAPR